MAYRLDLGGVNHLVNLLYCWNDCFLVYKQEDISIRFADAGQNKNSYKGGCGEPPHTYPLHMIQHKLKLERNKSRGATRDKYRTDNIA